MLLAVVLETPIASANASWATRRSRRAAFRRWPTSRATRRAISGVREEDRDAAMAVNVVIQWSKCQVRLEAVKEQHWTCRRALPSLRFTSLPNVGGSQPHRRT